MGGLGDKDLLQLKEAGERDRRFSVGVNRSFERGGGNLLEGLSGDGDIRLARDGDTLVG